MKWTTEQDAVLIARYWDAPMYELAAETNRSVQAIYARARLLKLKRKYDGGFKIGNKVRNNRPAKPRSATIEQRVAALLESSADAAWTSPQVADALKVARPAVTMALNHLRCVGKIHVAEYRKSRSKHRWLHVAAYRWGDGENAMPPSGAAAIQIQIIDSTPSPVPQPWLDAWTARVLYGPAAPAEMDAA